MMLKKQTVWLLAMLSLIIVLSVYYMSSPNPSPSDSLAVPADNQDKNHDQDHNKKEKDQKKSTDQEKSKQQDKKTSSSSDESQKATENKSGTATTQVADEEAFASAKVGMKKARSKMKAEYTDVIASDKASPEKKSQAKEKIDNLQQLSSKEQMLESLIKANGYKDALVSAQGDVVNVIVKANELSNKQVVEIIDMVKDHLDDPYDVAVSFRPNKK